MEIIDLSKHNVNQTNSYIFDTNVWLFIHGPIAGNEQVKQQKYSSLLRDIINRNAGLYVTSLVLSEYINRVLRLGFRQWKKVTGNQLADFKTDYRTTQDYEQQLVLAKTQVEDILKIATKRPDDFNALDVDAILTAMSQTMDYNDSYLVSQCERGNLILVSDDKDFLQSTSRIKLIQADLRRK